jgi:hypothetical protein
MRRLAARGLALDVPQGWDARIYRRAEIAGERTHAVLHAANFALPEERGDYGSGAVERMGSGHVLVALLEFDPEVAGTPLFANAGVPRELSPTMFAPNQLQRTIAGQAGTQVFCHENGRAFCLYVVLGAYRERTALVPRANEILRTVSVGRRTWR